MDKSLHLRQLCHFIILVQNVCTAVSCGAVTGNVNYKKKMRAT